MLFWALTREWMLNVQYCTCKFLSLLKMMHLSLSLSLSLALSFSLFPFLPPLSVPLFSVPYLQIRIKPLHWILTVLRFLWVGLTPVMRRTTLAPTPMKKGNAVYSDRQNSPLNFSRCLFWLICINFYAHTNVALCRVCHIMCKNSMSLLFFFFLHTCYDVHVDLASTSWTHRLALTAIYYWTLPAVTKTSANKRTVKLNMTPRRTILILPLRHMIHQPRPLPTAWKLLQPHRIAHHHQKSREKCSIVMRTIARTLMPILVRLWVVIVVVTVRQVVGKEGRWIVKRGYQMERQTARSYRITLSE